MFMTAFLERDRIHKKKAIQRKSRDKQMLKAIPRKIFKLIFMHQCSTCRFYYSKYPLLLWKYLRNNFQQIYYHSSFVYVRYLIQHFLKQFLCDYNDLKFSNSKFVTNWFWLMDWQVESDGWVIIAFFAISDRHNRSKY